MTDQTDIRELIKKEEFRSKIATSAEDFQQEPESKSVRVGDIYVSIYSPKESADFLRIYNSPKKEGIVWEMHFAPGGQITTPEDTRNRFRNTRTMARDIIKLSELSVSSQSGFSESRPDLIFGITPNGDLASILKKFDFSVSPKDRDGRFKVVNKNPDDFWKKIQEDKALHALAVRATMEIEIPTQKP